MLIAATPAPDTPSWLVWAGGVAVAASLVVAARILIKLQDGGPVIEPEPRQDVPWGGGDVLAVVGLPWLGPLLTDGQYPLQVPAVVGWVAFAASVAAVTPYGSLAAVRGRQVAVLTWRVLDSVVSLIAVVVVVLAGRSAEWVPIVLAVGSLLGGLAIRQLVLRREVRRSPVPA